MNWNAARYLFACAAELTILASVWMFAVETVASTRLTAQMTGPMVCLGTMMLAITGPALVLAWLSVVDLRASLHETLPEKHSAAA